MRKSLFVCASVAVVLVSGNALADGVTFPRMPRVNAETALA